MDGLALEHLLAGGPRLTVGLNTADQLRLGEELRLLETARAELVHIDVMDGVFCPMLTVGPAFIKALQTPLLKDAHLMIDDPLPKVESFVQAGADLITFHIEGARQPLRVLQVLGGAANVNDPGRGIVRGIALNPSTPVAAIEPLLDEAEYVLVLAINPGWGGQAFLSSTERRLGQARRLIDASGRRILLGVDGGVTRQNIGRVAALGADLIVSGSAIFDGKAAAENAAFMLDQVRAARPQPPLVPA
ncbi:MAG: ribulose-phosphate 3-epimerase [Candidatus Limnocylindrales bacterium]